MKYYLARQRWRLVSRFMKKEIVTVARFERFRAKPALEQFILVFHFMKDKVHFGWQNHVAFLAMKILRKKINVSIRLKQAFSKIMQEMH